MKLIRELVPRARDEKWFTFLDARWRGGGGDCVDREIDKDGT